jgi:hypothetical protein
LRFSIPQQNKLNLSMENNTYIGIYWESNVDLTKTQDLIIETLNYLKDIDSSINCWYETERPKKDKELIPIENSKECISALIKEGLINDDEGTLEEDLGTIITLKSDKSYERSNVISFSCGNTSTNVPNSVVLSISELNKDLLKINTLHSILIKFIAIWNPEYGIVAKHSHEGPIITDTIELGLITYIKTNIEEFAHPDYIVQKQTDHYYVYFIDLFKGSDRLVVGIDNSSI